MPEYCVVRIVMPITAVQLEFQGVSLITYAVEIVDYFRRIHAGITAKELKIQGRMRHLKSLARQIYIYFSI